MRAEDPNAPGPGRSPIATPTATGTLTPSQKVAWLRLIRTDNVGPVTFRNLIQDLQLVSLSAPLPAHPYVLGPAAARLLVQVFDHGPVFVDHHLALDAELGGELAVRLGEILRQDGEPLDALE